MWPTGSWLNENSFAPQLLSLPLPVILIPSIIHFKCPPLLILSSLAVEECDAMLALTTGFAMSL